MNIRQVSLALAALLSASACEAPETTAPPAPQTVQQTPRATGFITRNQAAPEGAADSRKDGVMRDDDGRPFSYAFLGERLPSHVAKLSTGTTIDLAAPGKWTVIDVWGIWCGDCMADAPYAAALSRAIAADPELAFVSIHVPASRTRTTPEEMFGKYGSVAAYMQANAYAYPVIIDADASLREKLKISWTPTYLLVSPDGIVRGFRTDLSVVDGEPVKDFMRDISRVRGEVRKAGLETAVPATIGPAGAMRLTAGTPFTLEAFAQAFPAQVVIADRAMSGGVSYPVYHIEAPGPAGAGPERYYTLEPDWTNGFVARVITRSAAVAGPNGEVIGATKRSSQDAKNLATCESRPHANRKGAFSVCRPFGATFEYWYEMNGRDGVLAEMHFVPPPPAKAR